MFRKIKNFFTHEEKLLRDNRWIFLTMLLGAVASLLASLVLSIEAFILAGNADAVLTCDFNAAISCGNVASHWSAQLLGFPNSFLGLMAEPVVITVAVAGLAGVKFPRAFMFAAQTVYTAGFIFALWMFGMSYFVIGSLCPWCLLVTLTTVLVWFAITRYNIRENNLYLPKKLSNQLKGYINKSYDTLAMASVVVLLVLAIIVKYGDQIL